MRGAFLGVMFIIGIGLAAIAAILLGDGAAPNEQGRPPATVTVVPAATPAVASLPTPTPFAHAPELAEASADTTTIAPYRIIVSRALGLDAAAAYRGIVVADPRQQIVCGAVRSRADSVFRAFVFVGSAGIAALDDGSAEFEGMQAGACNRHL